ncbi:hypothetical protein Hanom_Chr04g00375491 [Helianthus anomalus]
MIRLKPIMASFIMLFKVNRRRGLSCHLFYTLDTHISITRTTAQALINTCCE